MAQEQPVTDIVRRTIERDIAARTAAHQAAMAGLRAVSAAAARPLALLAHGDSWFDYPLSGNDLSLSRTDVVKRCRRAFSLRRASGDRSTRRLPSDRPRWTPEKNHAGLGALAQ